ISTPDGCPTLTSSFGPPAKCGSVTSCSGRPPIPSSTAPKPSGPTSDRPISMRRSPHISAGSVALAHDRRRSPIEVADAPSDQTALNAARRSNMVVRIGTTMVLVRDWRGSLTRWALAVGGSLYLAFMLSFYLSLYFLHQPDPNHLGFGYVIAVFGAIWVGDTAAMVAGLRFGRHHFFARIS